MDREADSAKRYDAVVRTSTCCGVQRVKAEDRHH